MNAHVSPERLKRARFTVAQILALIEKGVMNEDARFELLDGEIIPMSPKGPLHEGVRQAINRWIKTLPDSVEWLVETTLYLDRKSFVEPDYVVYEAGLAFEALTPEKVMLAIEVGRSSWTYDTETKAPLYAKLGVHEYWAINAASRMTRVHREPGATGWRDVRDHAAGESIAPLCTPDVALRLSPLRGEVAAEVSLR